MSSTADPGMSLFSKDLTFFHDLDLDIPYVSMTQPLSLTNEAFPYLYTIRSLCLTGTPSKRLIVGTAISMDTSEADKYKALYIVDCSTYREQYQ